MRLLLVNDDGIDAPGIDILAKAMQRAGHEILVAAPLEEHSGASHSVTLRRNVRIERVQREYPAYAIEGTPADCTKHGLQTLLPNPDYVLAGINSGANLGMHILYSGTVGAAMDAAMIKVPAIALSCLHAHMEPNYAYAAEFAVSFLNCIGELEIPEHTLLNINFPVRNPPKGVRITRQAVQDHIEGNYIVEHDESGYTVGWKDETLVMTDESTDLWAVQNGYVSISPLQYDITNHAAKALFERADLLRRLGQ